MKNKELSSGSAFISSMVALARDVEKQPVNTWLSDYRTKQIKKLELTEFPHEKMEHFKYNRLETFKHHVFSRGALNANQSINISSYQGLEINESFCLERIVFVNGQFSAELSHIVKHNVTLFSEANAQQQEKILSQLYSQDISHNPFSQINASVTDEGVLLEVLENSSAPAIEILSITNGEKQNMSIILPLVIDVADNSTVTLINRSLSESNTTREINFSSQRTLINVGKNAQVIHYALQLENDSTLHFGSSEYNLSSHATLKAFYGATGSALKKMDITINHQGQHAHAFLDGLYVATDDQQIDYHTTINHPLPNGQTDEVFRGIVNGNAEATFNGRIHIFEDAQKTRAELSNKNLLLSDSAVVHTKPELEIYADDVVCAHGATVSHMSDESRNYLLARGIPKDEAELMLSYGFFNEILDKLAHPSIANYLRPILFKRFN